MLMKLQCNFLYHEKAATDQMVDDSLFCVL